MCNTVAVGADITEDVGRSVWYGWGNPARAAELPGHATAFLRTALELDSVARDHLPVRLDQVSLPESSLDESRLALFRDALGAEHVSTAAADRVLHAGGKSTPDLYRRRTGNAQAAPDAVLSPGSDQEIRKILEICVREHIAVTPFGGGTSVVGGVEPIRSAPNGQTFTAAVALDLGRMAQLLELDPVNRLATFQTGIRGPAIEAALAAHGFTLGHLPQSHQQATLGGYLATRSAGQASTGYGRSDALVRRLSLESPRGTLDLGGFAPATAAGPDLRSIVVGSEGTLGVITKATMAIVPQPEHKRHGAWAFADFESGTEALRALVQAGIPLPAVARLSDREETESTLRLAGGAKIAALRKYLALRGMPQPALALFVWEGGKAATAAARRQCAKLLRAAGAVYLSSAPATSWEHGRFSAPYLRDRLLDIGVLVETLETATSWDRLPALHEAVNQAILGAISDGGKSGWSQAHVSHVYPGGASLYFTFLAGQESDPLQQLQRIKAAASEAIVKERATITHHHAIGTDHAPYLAAEIGPLGVDVLRSIKAALDPTGIMNPGKLIPAMEEDQK
ncbi:MAG: FAD-binding oxidoreductase [Renibacterium sp.]|nr:FAD-binding oxidoreductase [Renibacterium sp.]